MFRNNQKPYEFLICWHLSVTLFAVPIHCWFYTFLSSVKYIFSVWFSFSHFASPFSVTFGDALWSHAFMSNVSLFKRNARHSFLLSQLNGFYIVILWTNCYGWKWKVCGTKHTFSGTIKEKLLPFLPQWKIYLWQLMFFLFFSLSTHITCSWNLFFLLSVFSRFAFFVWISEQNRIVVTVYSAFCHYRGLISVCTIAFGLFGCRFLWVFFSSPSKSNEITSVVNMVQYEHVLIVWHKACTFVHRAAYKC